MARTLQRLGLSSAAHPWRVIAVWVFVLALAVGGFFAGHGTLATGVTMPGTKTQEVADELAERFPEMAGGSGMVVFETEDGAAFTSE